MKFDTQENFRKNNFLYQLSFYIFSILILLLSPNYLMQIFPFAKLVWGLLFSFFIFILIIYLKDTRLNFSSLCLFAFYILLFVCSFFNFIRYNNQDGIYFSLTIFSKFLLIYLFLMSLNIFYFITAIKSFIYTFFAFCLHSLIGWFLFVIGIVQTTSTLELSTYYYNIMSIWGAYTVSFPIGSMNLIRNQSFFQEPAAFAFYIFITMAILVLLKDFFTKKHYNTIYLFLFITMLSTLSATGIVLSILLSLFVFGSKVLNIIFAAICTFILSYTIFSDNPYVNKIGSFEERIYGITNGVHIFDQDPIAFLIGTGYNSESYFGFDGKFNSFALEIILYSGVLNLLVFLIFLISLRGLSKNFYFFYFLILFFCLTTSFFWSPIMIIFNLFALRFVEIQRRVY